MLPVVLGVANIVAGLRHMRYFIDSHLRDKVTPVAGSVVYCDLLGAVEHSGIHIDDGEISNIVVDSLLKAESTVRRSGPADFTSRSKPNRKLIYVSCDGAGAVGHRRVAHAASSEVGERAFYGLVIKNCHQFSTRCVETSGLEFQASLAESIDVPTTWEPTLLALKFAARKKLGATKWRLWDWQAQHGEPSESMPEPDWQALTDHFKNIPLNDDNMARVYAELADTLAYEAEVGDENLPPAILQHLARHRLAMAAIVETYEAAKDFLSHCPNAGFTYGDLQTGKAELAALAQILQDGRQIKELSRQLGRNHISAEKKKRAKIPQAGNSEVHGIHRSADLMRALPSELLNLENETLETLFFARLLENGLQSYELQGVTSTTGDEDELHRMRTGPVVACLDTSGSMKGGPILKGKALLLAIANMLKTENRSLHVLLFGASGEIREFSMTDASDSAGLLKFLRQDFGGGTDFETPLRHALDIIGEHNKYLKADVLMISDGDARISSEFANWLQMRKSILDCSIYSVLCAGVRSADGFSDEVVVL